uniref:Uncharacterized protein n=1 Tax=Onchocerca volvulus TaxID=6282 RepID=A0A8R1Y1P2_ONCVO
MISSFPEKWLYQTYCDSRYRTAAELKFRNQIKKKKVFTAITAVFLFLPELFLLLFAFYVVQIGCSYMIRVCTGNAGSRKE